MRVLIIDDEQLIRRTLRRAFADHQVVLAESCAEARDHLESSTFDLVLSDIHLPDGIGSDLHAFIVAEGIDVSCFALMTGSDVEPGKTDIDFGDGLEKVAVLTKPFGRRAITDLIKRAEASLKKG